MKSQVITAPVIRTQREGGPEINNAEDIANHMLDFAKYTFEVEQEVEPMLMILRKETVEFVSIQNFMNDNSTKDALRSMVVSMCSKGDVEGVGMAMEAWMVVNPGGLESITAPSEHPDRVEILMVYGEWKDCTTTEFTLKIIREENNPPRLGDPVKYDSSVGRMRNFFTQNDKSKLH